MSDQPKEFYDRNTTRIRQITASIFGNNEVQRYSVCQDKDDSISRAELYEGGAQPKRGGLVDSRLGAVNQTAVCGHCGLTSSSFDPGHFGHTVFHKRKFHIGFMPFVKSLLSVICIRCSKPYIQKHAPEMVAQLRSKKNSRARLAANKKLCKGIKHCPNCSVMVPKITTPKGAGARTTGSIEILAEYKGAGGDDSAADGKKKVVKILSADKCYDIFNNMDNDDCVLLGLDPSFRNRPEDLIIKNLPYPPNTIRPSVHMESASDATREDQMTHKLSDILKGIAKESKQRGDSEMENSNNKAPDLAQFHYATYLDNGSVAMPRSEQKGAPTKSIRDRIRAKTGRVRYNLMGKRVNFSGRSVITPDPSIKVSELGVPQRVCMRLTYPVTVTDDNIADLRDCVKNGADNYPGANFVVPVINGVKQRPKFLNLKGLKREVILNIGDIVHRHLQDGDVVLFNRQPTLHRQSMMGHFVRVIRGSWASFRIHVSVCQPYNADFDGDEMNIHVPQNEQTSIELFVLGCVTRQIISPGKCKPLIGTVQDLTLATYSMSDDSTQLDSRTAMNIMAHSGLTPSILHRLKQGKTYSGKHLLSMLLPQEINCVVKGSKSDNKGDAVIVRGQIQEPGGNLNKSAFGSVRNGILHQSWNEFAHQGTAALLDRVNHVVTAYMRRVSFTAGVKDVGVPESVERKIDMVIATKLLEVNHLITEAESSTVMQEVAVLEPIIQGELDSVRDIVGKTAVFALGKDNAFNIMEAAGSKGSLLNTAQMTAAVGQQALEGKRIVKKVYGRTLPHFYQNDDSGPARGFIVNNYNKGLTPAEFIFHMMTGREGLIDTAIKTAETGYIQRRLVKAMEDLMVLYDATVRTAGGALLQPLYGYNSINPIYQAQIKIGMMLMNDKDLRKTYCFTEAEAKKYVMSSSENEAHYRMLIGMRDTLRHVQTIVSRNAMILNDTVTSPINFAQLIRKYVAMAEDYPNETQMDSRYIMFKITDMLGHEATPMMRISKKDYDSADCAKLKDEELAKTFLRIIFYEYLSPKRILVEHKFGRQRFDAMCEEALERFTESTVAPGEMVGTIGAQSTGEPATQMSASRNTEVLVMKYSKTGGNGIFRGKIYKLIDNIIKNNQDDTRTISKDSVETTLENLEHTYYIASLNADETLKWAKISHVSRHPTNGKLVRFKTLSGREIIATPSHSFLKRTEDSFKPVKAEDLKIGDRMPVSRKLPRFSKLNPTTHKIGNFRLVLNRLSGWFIGAYLADGSLGGSYTNVSKVSTEYQAYVIRFAEQYDLNYKIINREHVMHTTGKYKDRVYQSHSVNVNSTALANFLLESCGKGSHDKRVPSFVHAAPLEFIAGVIQGYFDGDGNVNVPKNMIRTGSVSKALTTDFALLLNYFGIYASICKEQTTDASGQGRETNPLFTLQLPYKYAETFLDEIGSCYAKRLVELKAIIKYSDKKTESNSHQEYIDKIPELGACIGRIGTVMNLPGASRNYRRWENKESIGRKTLQEYVELFTNEAAKFEKKLAKNGGCLVRGCGNGSIRTPVSQKQIDRLHKDIGILKQAADSDVIWDEIIEYEYIDDPKEYVYDFTVPGTQTFMLGDGLLTHNTLNTFHQAGIASKGAGAGISGVPRLRELLGASKNPKTPKTVIQLEEKYQDNIEVAQRVASTIRYTIMEHITHHVDIIYDPEPMAKGGWMERDNATNVFHAAKCQSDISGLPWLMRIVLNREGMLNTGVQLLDIKAKFCAFWANRIKEAKKLKRKEEKQVMDKITRVAILSNYSTSDELVIHIRYDTTAVNYSSHVAFCDVIQNRFKLKGIDGLTGTVDVIEDNYKTFDNTGAVVERKRFAIVTEGVNLLELRRLNCIDLQKTTTNHVVHITMVMGIEASRAAMKRELKSVIEGSGSDADYRHLCLLADLATNSGDLVPIDRHGMMKFDADFLAKATNETTVEQLLNSAFFGDIDNMNNVSSRIMTGMPFNGGGNMGKIFIDFDELQKSEYLPEESSTARSFTALTENQAIDDILRQTEREV